MEPGRVGVAAELQLLTMPTPGKYSPGKDGEKLKFGSNSDSPGFHSADKLKR